MGESFDLWFFACATPKRVEQGAFSGKECNTNNIANID